MSTDPQDLGDPTPLERIATALEGISINLDRAAKRETKDRGDVPRLIQASSLGLDARELDMLSGYTTPATCALAELREAWLHADPFNRPEVAKAIEAISRTFRHRDSHARALRVLLHRVDEVLALELAAIFVYKGATDGP